MSIDGRKQRTCSTTRSINTATGTAGYVKTAMAALDTTDGLAVMRTLGDAFLELARKRSILGRLIGIRSVPTNVAIPLVSTGAVGHWVPQTGLVPASALAVSAAFLPPAKLGALIALSRELMGSTAPQVTSLLERDLQRAVTTMEDATLLDALPAVALGGRADRLD